MSTIIIILATVGALVVLVAALSIHKIGPTEVGLVTKRLGGMREEPA